MPLHDAETQRLEQLLSALTPPAEMTAPYRQRVMQASLEARGQILTRRQRRRTLCCSVWLLCLLMLPFWLVAASGVALRLPDRYFPWPVASSDLVEPFFGALPASIDRYELSVIQSSPQSRYLKKTHHP